jgi:hypothetical protein
MDVISHSRIGRCLVTGLVAAFVLADPGLAQENDDLPPLRALLRLVSDSAVVGYYKFTVSERQQLVFDIAADDPRRELLESATVPNRTTTEISATVVSTPTADDEDRRYVAYWLGYRVTGRSVQSLNVMQWDSIFKKAGRRGELKFSPRGHPKGVEVVEAARPVGQALADALSGLALPLPADSVSEGSSWEDKVALVLAAPNGSRWGATVRVTFRLRELRQEPEGVYARIEFDGEPIRTSDSDIEIQGRYFGDSVFDVTRGRYDRMLALANLEVEWEDKSGLPPSRTLIEWQAQVARR